MLLRLPRGAQSLHTKFYNFAISLVLLTFLNKKRKRAELAVVNTVVLVHTILKSLGSKSG
jgi:hypothetical protein